MAARKPRTPPAAAHAYDGLDRVLHEKARLAMLTALLARPQGVLFPDLKQLCNLTDGNLARHLQVLHEAGLVEVWKNQQGPRSRTLLRLSRKGRTTFLAYLDELERVIRDARARSGQDSKDQPEAPRGWVPA
jgi:DNA-binding MarR family transcriptional regulator